MRRNSISGIVLLMLGTAMACGSELATSLDDCLTEILDNEVLIHCPDGSKTTLQLPDDSKGSADLNDCDLINHGDGTYTLDCDGQEPIDLHEDKGQSPDHADDIYEDSGRIDTTVDAGTPDSDSDDAEADSAEDAQDEPPQARLILHQQSPPPLWRLVERQAEIDALPFDGTTFSIPSSFTIHTSTPVSLDTLREELAGYADLAMTQVTSHWVMVYASPAGPITDYQAVINNFANLAQAAKEFGLAGIFYDTEEYFGPTWSPDILGPDRPTAEVLDETRDKGSALAQAVAERWPDAKILITLGPWVAEPLSAAPQFLGEACMDTDGLIFNIAPASQGMGAFTLGIALGSLNSNLTFIDGAEIYTPRTFADWERSYDWISQGFATHSDLVPAPLKQAYAEQIEVAQATYDFPDSYRCKGPTDATDWQLDIENALKTSDSIAWAYSERFDWVGNLNSEKPAPPLDWTQATTRGKAAGQPQ